MEDEIVKELLKLTKDSEVTMTINGVADTYKFCDKPNDVEGFELYSTTQDNVVYGLSCCCALEAIGVLIQDYANGIITEVKVS